MENEQKQKAPDSTQGITPQQKAKTFLHAALKMTLANKAKQKAAGTQNKIAPKNQG